MSQLQGEVPLNEHWEPLPTWPSNFPTIDKIQDGVATSIKILEPSGQIIPKKIQHA